MLNRPSHRCEANLEPTIFYPWYFENRPLEHELSFIKTQCDFFKSTCANIVEIA